METKESQLERAANLESRIQTIAGRLGISPDDLYEGPNHLRMPFRTFAGTSLVFQRNEAGAAEELKALLEAGIVRKAL